MAYSNQVSPSIPHWPLRTKLEDGIYAVGVGGSLLIIGSAAGIVAMSKMPGLTFMTYLRSFGLLLMAFAFGFVAVYGLGLLVS